MDTDGLFSGVGLKVRVLSDVAGLFRRNERDMLEDELEKFMRTFPQLFFAVYTGSPDHRGDLRQFGFWMLNRGVFEDVPRDRSNGGGILLMLDPERKSAGISYGYLLDAFLEEGDTFESLSRAHAYWLEGKYAEGVMRCLSQLTGLLKVRCRQVRRNMNKYEGRVRTELAVENLVKKIRTGSVGGGLRSEGEEVR